MIAERRTGILVSSWGTGKTYNVLRSRKATEFTKAEFRC